MIKVQYLLTTASLASLLLIGCGDTSSGGKFTGVRNKKPLSESKATVNDLKNLNAQESFVFVSSEKIDTLYETESQLEIKDPINTGDYSLTSVRVFLKTSQKETTITTTEEAEDSDSISTDETDNLSKTDQFQLTFICEIDIKNLNSEKCDNKFKNKKNIVLPKALSSELIAFKGLKILDDNMFNPLENNNFLNIKSLITSRSSNKNEDEDSVSDSSENKATIESRLSLDGLNALITLTDLTQGKDSSLDESNNDDINQFRDIFQEKNALGNEYAYVAFIKNDPTKDPLQYGVFLSPVNNSSFVMAINVNNPELNQVTKYILTYSLNKTIKNARAKNSTQNKSKLKDQSSSATNNPEETQKKKGPRGRRRRS